MTVHSEENNITRSWGRLAFDIAHCLVAIIALTVCLEVFRGSARMENFPDWLDILNRGLILASSGWVLSAMDKVWPSRG